MQTTKSLIGQGDWTASWIRAYHTPRLVTVDKILDPLQDKNLLTRQDDNGLEFFDIQALRACHFGTAKGPEFTMQGDLDVGRGDSPRRVPIILTGSCHILAHASGFVALRLTIDSQQYPVMRRWGNE